MAGDPAASPQAADGDAGVAQAVHAGRELWELRRDMDTSCPLSPAQTGERFHARGDVLDGIHATEVAAIDALASARADAG